MPSSARAIIRRSVLLVALLLATAPVSAASALQYGAGTTIAHASDSSEHASNASSWLELFDRFTLVLVAISLLTPAEAAELLRTTVKSLERWRGAGGGPTYVKIGRRVAYRECDLEAWLEQQRRAHTGVTSAA